MEDFANNFSTLMGTKVFDTDVKTIAVKVLIFIGVFAIAYVLQRVAAKITRKALKNMEDLPSATIIVGIVRALIWVIALLCILEPVFGIPILQHSAFIKLITLNAGVIFINTESCS